MDAEKSKNAARNLNDYLFGSFKDNKNNIIS
jgi:hypothetical protein